MDDFEADIEVGPHVSALDPEAMEQLQSEVMEKEALGQAKVVMWEDIKKDPPKALKMPRIAMIPHKSRKFQAILDLSYTIKLMELRIEAVNDTTTKTVPQGAMDRMVHILDHIIYAYAEVDEEDIFFSGKTDMKDGFLEVRSGRRSIMELCLRARKKRRWIHSACHSDVATNGLDRIPRVLLCRL